MKKRAIIIAAGEATRWNNYLGVSKHFIEIDGEPIIKRTVRLLLENGVDDIYVVGKTKEYEIEGSKLYVPKLTPEYHDADKFLSSKDLWLRYEDGGGKTMVLYGDVYFTEYAIDKIVHCDHKDWLLFGRALDSELTTNCGECFAQTFYEGQVDQHERALYKLIEYYNSGKLGRIGGWEHYRIMTGIPEEIIHIQRIGGQFVEINDWTDDFDLPGNYDLFTSRRKSIKKCYVCGGSRI